MSRMPLLRELIDIPESISDSDLVMKLASGVEHIDQTLADYVITDSLVGNFDAALNLIRAAVTGRTSKAAYLHGSFGAGKSHFMCVLHALLQGVPAARQRPEFATLLDRHDWLPARSFLLVPVHMLGAKSLEQRVFDRYIRQMRALHPDAPAPYVHRTESLLEEARYLRQQIGDERFIAGLAGESADADAEAWGETTAWTAEALDRAFAGDHDDELRHSLVNGLLASWKQGFFHDAGEAESAYVSLDRGLREISNHARSLGYDGLILFLDELILWLINSAADLKFVHREIQKVTNLVESGDADRTAPVVSFIARQRDLREALGAEVTGATELSVIDTLDLASARFDEVRLDDRNLPVVARERILKPVDDAAARQIGEAFVSTTRELTQPDLDVLFGEAGGIGADIDSFRATYPFSPAFMNTLQVLAEALQRTRTGLKLMRRLLYLRREELRLGQLIPIGDLYDVLAEGGDEPFTQKLKAEFEAIQKLYGRRLRPHLLQTHQLTEDDLSAVRAGRGTGEQEAKVGSFTGDDRLMKTLLLSALAPSVPALRDLTASRLAALNHGSITDPFGDVISKVARKVEDWAVRFTEVHYEGGNDPMVGLRLVGVDVDSVLASARHVVAEGSRKKLLQNLLYEAFGITTSGQLQGDRYDVVWRGSKRTLEVRYGNVRDRDDILDTDLEPSDASSWRLVIDYPFDLADKNPSDDVNRLRRPQGRRIEGRTVAWVPAQLSVERRRDLDELVVLDYLLAGQRFDEHAGHLNADDRLRAGQVLTEQRRLLTEKLRETLRQAYGVVVKQPTDVVVGFDDHLHSLQPGFTPKLAAGASLADAMRELAGQMLAHQFPAHPDLDPDRSDRDVRVADARTVLEYVRRSADNNAGPVEVEKVHRPLMRRIADRLGLGTTHDPMFVVDAQWREHVNREAAKDGISGDIPVKRLREWIDRPEPRGLDSLVANLVIASYAELADRTWTQHGTTRDPPDVSKVDDGMALRARPLPDERTWQIALDRAKEIFGLNPSPILRHRLVADLAGQLTDVARRYGETVRQNLHLLQEHAEALGLDPDASEGRLRFARRGTELLDGFGAQYDYGHVIDHLVEVDIGDSGRRLGRAIKSAADVNAALIRVSWNNLELLREVIDRRDQHAPDARVLLERLGEAATADQLTTPLEPVLSHVQVEAGKLLKLALASQTGRTAGPPGPTSPGSDGPTTPVGAGPTLTGDGGSAQAGSGHIGLPDTELGLPGVATGSSDDKPGADGSVTYRGPVDEALARLRRVGDQHPGAIVEVTWRMVDEP